MINWFLVNPQILRLHGEFGELRRIPTSRRGESWKEKVLLFHRRVSSSLFDIACDQNRRRRQEIFYGVKMTHVEFEFLEDQRGPRKQICDDVVDKQWKKTAERKAKEEESFRRREERAKVEAKKMEKIELTDELVDEIFQDVCIQSKVVDDDDDYVPEEEEEEGEPEEVETRDMPPKRRRLEMDNSAEVEEQENSDIMPPKRRRLETAKQQNDGTHEVPLEFRHLRNSIRSVKAEYYATIVQLKTQFHCSDAQAVAGVVLTGQKLFRLPWKFFDTDKNVIDLDTAPSSANNRREARVRELFVLSEIAEKVMKSDHTSTVTYHDDGSRKQGTGAFSVQGVSIDRQYHPLPTLSITRETRTNLMELKVITFVSKHFFFHKNQIYKYWAIM